jgi:hypothetical protein
MAHQRKQETYHTGVLLARFLLGLTVINREAAAGRTTPVWLQQVCRSRLADPETVEHNKMMKTPLVLPWLAQRAGVSEERAEELWHEANRQAEAMTGERNTSCYWGAVVAILNDLLAGEAWRPQCALAWPWLLLWRGIEQWSWLLQRCLSPSGLPPTWRTRRLAMGGGLQ